MDERTDALIVAFRSRESSAAVCLSLHSVRIAQSLCQGSYQAIRPKLEVPNATFAERLTFFGVAVIVVFF